MFTEIIQPGFSDTDALGHINNTCHPVWFENARTPIFRIFHPSLDFHVWPLIVARVEIDYLAQTHWDTPVEIRTYVGKIGNSSCHIKQQAWQNDVQVAAGTTVLIHFDYKNNQSVTIPDSIISQLSEHLPSEDG